MENILLDPAKTALVVVDMQNDFCHPDGALTKGAWDATDFNRAIGPNVTLVKGARDAGALVIFTRILWDDGKPPFDSPARMKPRLAQKRDPNRRAIMTGTWGGDVVDELKPRPGDLVVDKKMLSSFVGTNLDAELKSRGIQTCIITGVVTYACVMATAYGARDHGYNVVMVKEATGSYWKDLDDPIFRIVDTIMGYAVKADEIEFGRAAVAA
jgi:ureidoacrylate peracid hydrolase